MAPAGACLYDGNSFRHIQQIQKKGPHGLNGGEPLDEKRTTDALPARRPEDLPPAARRALAEAEERRRRKAGEAQAPPEIGGRKGLDPARYGDWEVKGIASDF